MTSSRRVLASAAAFVITISVTAVPSTAQEDSARVRRDSIPADSASLVQEAETPPPRTLPILEAEVPPGPLPPGARYTFTRDSLLWSSALTLTDLLARIPGVYVARAGFAGLPEYVQYGGRGGQALEVYWDGVPWTPLGGDTLFVDPGRFPLTYLRRVDVEVLPSGLRVYLVSERHETMDVRSKVFIESGTFKTAEYGALFQKRSRSGFAVDLAAHFLGTDGPDQSAGSDAFDIWAKLAWTPNDRVGASYQVRRQNVNRDPLTGPGGFGVPAREGARTEYQLAMFAATRSNGMGLRADAGLATSTWSADSGSALEDQRVQQAYAGLRYRTRSWTAELRGRVADRWTLLAAEARLGWVPFRGLVVAGDARIRRHEHDRTSSEVHGTAALYIGPFYVAGDLSAGETVQAPAIPSDTAQSMFDKAVRVGMRASWLTGHVGVVQRDAFLPRPLPELPAIPSLGPTAAATYLEAAVALRPVSALTLSGWYSDPIEGELAGLQPPNHFRTAITLRSKFWRTFRSGAFDFKAQVALESWGDGVAGVTADGSSITLPAATFWEMHLEIQLVSFTAFWSLRNSQLSDKQYVPGLTYPGNAQTFGASWTFSN